MDFLSKMGFDDSYINSLEKDVPSKIKESIIKNKKLVIANLTYFKNLGIENYQDVFLRFYDMFLIDYSSFISIFDKYEKDDLVQKIKKNINIVEYL